MSFHPGSKLNAAGNTVKTVRPSTRFTISVEASALKSRLIVTDTATGTELHYSNKSAEELLHTIALALGKSVHTTEHRMDRQQWRKEVTLEERKLEHRASEQKKGFATAEQLDMWGFNAEATAEWLAVQQQRAEPVQRVSLMDRRTGRMTNRP